MLKPEHVRRIAATAPGAVVTVTQRGYVAPPEPVPVPPPPSLATSADVERLKGEVETSNQETLNVLGQIETLIRAGNQHVVDVLAAPVRPVYDAKGKLLEARRIIPNKGD